VRKRTVTTVEMHEIVIVRRRAGVSLAQCSACLKEVEMVSLEQAAQLADISLRDICRRVGDGDIHLVETAEGGLVCTNSLLNKFALGGGELSTEDAGTRCQPAADLSDTADQ
jgi:hypothetical protein